MAKWGEGDDRWKVTELGESGRNVGNWHWVETNVLPWSQDRLKALLCSTVLVDNKDGTTVTTTDDITLTGDAIINQRKGKLISAYELNLTLKWKGTDADGEEANGEIKLPYISEENHDEDPEVQVAVSSNGTASEKMRTMIVNHGRPLVYKAIATFVEELRAGGPITAAGAGAGAGAAGGGASTTKNDKETATTTTTITADGGTQQPSETTTTTTPATAPPPLPQPAVKTSSFGASRSIEITENYFASCKDIYECFTDTGRVRAYTGSAAEIDATPGGAFSMFGGSIEGTFLELQPHSRIDMNWRFSSWPDGAFSRVVITLEEAVKGSVTLVLKQTEIPDADRYGNHDVLGMTQAGWKQQVLLRIRQVFGYGA